MRRGRFGLTLVFITGAALFGLLALTNAQEATPPVQHGPGFVDRDGDGLNDLAPDRNEDGIPNGLDPDYRGRGARHGKGVAGFVDENGDGINDWMQDFDGDGIVNRFDPDYPGYQPRGPKAMQHGPRRFIDMNGDGINDWGQDFDGDGILNCRDADWVAPFGMGRGSSHAGGRGHQRVRGHYGRWMGGMHGKGAMGMHGAPGGPSGSRFGGRFAE